MSGTFWILNVISFKDLEFWGHFSSKYTAGLFCKHYFEDVSFWRKQNSVCQVEDGETSMCVMGQL